jgi:hypothetical protein
MDQETRRNKIRDLIKAGTLPSYPSPADPVSGPAPCTGCGTTGAKMKFQRLPASLCHECAQTWSWLRGSGSPFRTATPSPGVGGASERRRASSACGDGRGPRRGGRLPRAVLVAARPRALGGGGLAPTLCRPKSSVPTSSWRTATVEALSVPVGPDPLGARNRLMACMAFTTDC